MTLHRSVAGFFAVAWLSAGCADPEGAYEDFVERRKAQAGQGGQGGQGPTTCDEIPAAGEIDGEYLFALSARVGGLDNNRDNPIMLLNTVTTTASADGLTMSWVLQPLLVTDRKTPTGDALTLSGIAVDAEGKYDSNPDELNVPGDANPLSGSPITADLTSLRGLICKGAEFFCGNADGDVSKPIPLSVDGSSFAMEKVEAGVYPEPPKTDCSGALAKPLGS